MACAVGSFPDGGFLTNDDGHEYCENFSRFLIIGGGIAGLSAASTLARRGVADFRLLEGRKRLGGRIITVQIGGAKAELGASWIHGVLGNPLYELAASHGLVDASGQPQRPHNVAATTEDGRRVPFGVLQEIYEAYYWFFKRCEEYFLCKYQPPQGVHSVGQHVKLEISIYLKRFPPQQRHLRQLIFDYLLKRECCITGCDSMDQVDLVGIGSYTELPGGNIQLPHGYASILSPMINSLPEKCVLKGHPVKHIHWKYRVEKEQDTNDDSDTDSVKTVKSAKEEEQSVQSSRATSVCCTPMHVRQHPNVMVECEDGKKFYTDHVVCTVPLGVLKSKPDLFVPPLPQSKKEAMEKLNFGTVNKIFLDYDRPFLSPDISEVILLWDTTTKEATSAVPMKDRWFRKIYSFVKVTETLLLGWISGEEAKYMETLKMNVVADTCTSVLRQFLADPYVPKPKACIFTAWNSQPMSLGSYSSIAVGGQQSHIEKLAEPLFQRPNNRTPVVAFGGEHCHPSFYSTGHGAYLSGRSAAQFFLTARQEEEEVYNLGAASVADLSSWLEEVSMGEKSLEDFKSHKDKSRPSRDNGKFTTPR